MASERWAACWISRLPCSVLVNSTIYDHAPQIPAAFRARDVDALMDLYAPEATLTDVGVALLIEFTAPVFVALWARFVLHEPVRRRVWAALALALVGMAGVAGVVSGGVDLDGVGVAAASGMTT